MSKFERDDNIMNGKGESDIDWITVKGNHIPIKDGESPGEAIKKHFAKKDKVNEQKRLRELGVEDNNLTQKIFGKSGISFDKNGDYEINYNIWEKELKEREKYFKPSIIKYEESFEKEIQLDWANLAFNDYSATMYNEINPYLYENKSGNERLEKRIKIIDDAINRYELPDNIKVYRTVDSSALENMGIKDIKNCIGEILNNQAYSSVSLDKEIMTGFINANKKTTGNKQVVMEINIPKGKNVCFPIFYKSSYKEEQEILLKRNSKIKIFDIEDKDGVWIIKGNML